MSARTNKSHTWPTRIDRVGQYVWARAKTANGQQVKPGDAVDNSKFSTRKLQGFLNERWICPVELYRPTGKAAIAAAAAAKAKLEPPADDGLHLKHVGSGRWAVVEGDAPDRLSELGTKEEAQGWLDELRASRLAAG